MTMMCINPQTFKEYCIRYHCKSWDAQSVDVRQPHQNTYKVDTQSVVAQQPRENTYKVDTQSTDARQPRQNTYKVNTPVKPW